MSIQPKCESIRQMLHCPALEKPLSRIQNCIRDRSPFAQLGLLFAGLQAGAAITAVVTFGLGMPIVAAVSAVAMLCFGVASAGLFASMPKKEQKPQEIPPPPQNLSSSSELIVEDSSEPREELRGAALYESINAKTEPVIPLPSSATSQGRYYDVACAANTACGIFSEELVSKGFEQQYIHANFISNPSAIGPQPLAIAGQAPMPQQKDVFWEAVHTHKVSTIIDLTNERDNIDPYAPVVENETLAFLDNQPVEVTCGEVTENGDWTASKIEIKVSENSRTIERLKYKNWPDRGVITVDQLDHLVSFLTNSIKDSDSPIFIHCRAGVGRTGVVLAALQLSLMEDLSEPEKAIEETVLRLRRERSTGMVQTEEQMQLLIDYACYLVELA